MKTKPCTSILSLLALIAALIPLPATAIDASNFHFESYEADHYLSRLTDGTSQLEVEETLVAIFPAYDQNHGITRIIATTNQDGKNFTMDPKTITIDVTRNGEPEPVAKVIGDDSYHEVYIGDQSTYLHGRQSYTLTYDFTKTITAPNGPEDPQELYWDTNGTGFSQRFDALTTRVHLDEASAAAWTGEAWCYVGTQNVSTQSRCKWEKLSDDLIEFTSTGSLAPGENLTYNLTFAPNTFVVPTPPKSYTNVFVAVVNFTLALTTIVLAIVAYRKHRERYLRWKTTPIAPEYQPPKNLAVAEAAALSTTAQSHLTLSATLVELAIKGHIKLEETKTKFLKKSAWHVKVISLTDLTPSELDALAIINAGHPVRPGETIDIKQRSATSAITTAQKAFTEHAKATLVEQDLFRQKSTVNGAYLIFPILTVFVTLALSVFAANLTESAYGVESVGVVALGTSVFISILSTIIAASIYSRVQKVATRTDKGLTEERRLEGLKLFIKMAEADRIKFFQSVKTAERIDTGNQKKIVKLYEKLLPYAIIFGLEKSWSAELEKHYAKDPSIAPVWFIGMHTFSASSFSSSLHSITTSVSSSSSSGASGSGFSGGGGGGGGGGGW
ncbi:DUF2207 domain-containing protein [Christensenellaceae bacterium OttesenSCG-928-L17]|nr:DUF2207 domain-containing protein [Christensenellaceae bacterium OttesenSCG-928-L17]